MFTELKNNMDEVISDVKYKFKCLDSVVNTICRYFGNDIEWDIPYSTAGWGLPNETVVVLDWSDEDTDTLFTVKILANECEVLCGVYNTPNGPTFTLVKNSDNVVYKKFLTDVSKTIRKYYE